MKAIQHAHDLQKPGDSAIDVYPTLMCDISSFYGSFFFFLILFLNQSKLLRYTEVTEMQCLGVTLPQLTCLLLSTQRA